MKNSTELEIEWREELIKRLQTPLKSLNKAYKEEQQVMADRLKELSIYNSPEDAHEAYGNNSITIEEYYQICDGFITKKESTSVSAARDELRHIISRLKGDIRDFKWEELPDEERARILLSNEEYKKRKWRLAP